MIDVEEVVGIIGPVFSSHAVKIDPGIATVDVPMLAGATDAMRSDPKQRFYFPCQRLECATWRVYGTVRC